jgi:hypothetical protein
MQRPPYDGTREAGQPVRKRPAGWEHGARSGAESAVIAACRRLRERRADGSLFAWFSNVEYDHGTARPWVLDLLCLYRGYAFVIEIDGPDHRRRWVADKSRDQLLEDAGFLLVRRIAVEDTNDPLTVDLFLDKCLSVARLRLGLDAA